MTPYSHKTTQDGTCECQLAIALLVTCNTWSFGSGSGILTNVTNQDPSSKCKH